MVGEQVKTFYVEMYQSVPVWIDVEAFTAEEAAELGEELIRNGLGRVQQMNVAYAPDRTVYTEDWELVDDGLF